MARPKRVKEEERVQSTVHAKLILMYGIEFPDTHELSGTTATGKTAEDVRKSALGAIARHLPSTKYDVSIELVNPENFERAGVNLDPYRE